MSPVLLVIGGAIAGFAIGFVIGAAAQERSINRDVAVRALVEEFAAARAIPFPDLAEAPSASRVVAEDLPATPQEPTP